MEVDSIDNIYSKLKEIRNLIKELPGIDASREELEQQLENERILSEEAGEQLIKAQKEAKKWLAFLSESENSLY